MTQQAKPIGVPRVVAVTGASGYIGERLVERLLAEDGVERVVGVDIKASAIENEKLTSLQQDISEPLDVIFKRHKVEAVVHLAFVLRQLRDREESRRINVGGTSNVLWACESAGISRLVLMSSATVYGAHSDNEEPLTEEAPLRPNKGFSYAEDKARAEWFVQRYQAQRTQTDVSVLRSCVVMGPNVSNSITQSLDKPVLIAVGKDDPPMQFVHEEDLLDLLWRFVSESHSGVYNIAGPQTVAWSEIAQLSGKRLVRLPSFLAYGMTNLSWLVRLQSDSPGAGLELIRWPWAVSTKRLEADLGYSFKHTSREAIEAYLGKPEESSPITPEEPPQPAV
jgi:UDP-glucose 4-epimerase